MISFKSRTFQTTTAHTAAWLLEQGARVVVKDDGTRRRVVSLVQKHARDGDDYERLMGNVLATGRGEPVDERVLFASAWKKKIIGIIGSNGKTTTAVWAAHLIGDAITLGPTTDKPVMSLLGSRARVAIMESPPRGTCSVVINTDDYESNRQASEAVARLMKVSWDTIRRRCETLPQIPHCQEVVSRNRTLTVVDDGGARTADQGIAALVRWGGPNCILVTGGRGAGDYSRWAEEYSSRVTANNTIFIAGSATHKMKSALGVRSRGIRTYDSLTPAWRAAKKRAGLFLSAVILYSPAAERIDTDKNPW